MVRALYGLKSAGDAFRNHMAECMHHLGLLSCPDELYIWMVLMMRPEDGFD